MNYQVTVVLRFIKQLSTAFEVETPPFHRNIKIVLCYSLVLIHRGLSQCYGNLYGNDFLEHTMRKQIL